MTNSQHTPGPWQATGRGIFTAYKGGEDITPATAAGKNEIYIGLVAERSTFQETESNANHIVKCVNAHDDEAVAIIKALITAGAKQGYDFGSVSGRAAAFLREIGV